MPRARLPPLETLLEEPSPNLIALQQAVKQQLDTPPLKPDYPQLRVVQIWQGNRNPTGCSLLSGRTAHNDGQTMTPEEIAQDKKRRLRQLARQRRRQRLLETLAKAQEAFQAGDIRLHYQFIRKLAPKAYRRKLCLKSDSGDLLSNTEECALLVQCAKDLFDDEPFPLPPLLPLDPEWFQPEYWEKALKSLQAHKAVRRGQANISSWKSHASTLSTALSNIAISALCCQQPTVPQGVGDGPTCLAT